MKEKVHSNLIIFPTDNVDVVKEKKTALERARAQEQSRQPIKKPLSAVDDAVRKRNWQLAGWLGEEIRRVKTEQ